MTCPLFVELCAGTAAVSLRLARARARPPVSRMGAKTGYADAILGLAGLRPGQGAGHYLWCEPDPGCRLLLEAYRDAALARAAADIIRGWAGEDPRALWERLRAEGPPRGPEASPGGQVFAHEVARWAWVQGHGSPDGRLAAQYLNPEGNADGSWKAPPRDWLARRAEALPVLPATIAPDARAVDPREVARWVTVGQLSYRQMEPASGFNPGMARDAASPCWRHGLVDVAGALSEVGQRSATILPDARQVDPREVARWAWIQRRSANGTGTGYNNGEGTHKISPDAPAPGMRGLPSLPATIAPDAREVDPREVARWAWLTRRSWKGQAENGYMGPDTVNPVADPVRQGARWTPEQPAPLIDRLPVLPATILPDAHAADPGPALPAGTVALFDPPYQGTTPYAHDLPRADVVAIARRWAAAGALVMVCEAEPIPELLADGWGYRDIAHARKGQARTFSRQTREVVTMSRPPVHVPAEQVGLFGGAR